MTRRLPAHLVPATPEVGTGWAVSEDVALVADLDGPPTAERLHRRPTPQAEPTTTPRPGPTSVVSPPESRWPVLARPGPF